MVIDAIDFAHAIFAPLHYEPGYAYPLIVWLHGEGADERQLQRVMPLVSMRNYVAIAPRGMPISAASVRRRERYGWTQTDENIQQAVQRVFDSIMLAENRFHLDSRRIFLCGFDGGGTMAVRIAMAYPSRFAGVISLCGPLPCGGTPLGNLRRRGAWRFSWLPAEAATRTPPRMSAGTCGCFTPRAFP